MIGVGEIELPVTALAATRPIAVLVDLTDVSFLASVGLRCIIQSAKTLDLKGGRMALLVGDNPFVRRTLEAGASGRSVPIRRSFTEPPAGRGPAVRPWGLRKSRSTAWSCASTRCWPTSATMEATPWQATRSSLNWGPARYRGVHGAAATPRAAGRNHPSGQLSN